MWSVRAGSRWSRPMKTQNLLFLLLPLAAVSAKIKPKTEEVSALDQYVTDATRRHGPATGNGESPGSLWGPSGLLTDLARDLRANRVDDLVTIQVTERADASSSGDTKTSRQSAAKSNIASLLGPKAAKGALANLASLTSS